ncbi:MAG: ParA family protein [Candidatus Bathyarchaeota archaeon]|nr:ParA family protein [Candidatus Termiticorpusculum sp.]
MSKIIAVHSYKGGTGKTSISVNLAATFVRQGKKVALFDLDFRAPSLFAILQCEKEGKTWLNDYLDYKCEINQVLVDISPRIPNAGKFYAGPADPSTESMRYMTTRNSNWEMHALKRLMTLKKSLIKEQNFDYIIFDTSPGLQFSSMNAIAAADFIVVTTTGDCSDVNGTKRMLNDFYDVMFENKTGLVLNKVIDPAKYGTEELAQKVKEEYKVPLLCVIPCFCEVTQAKGQYLFPQDKPNHQFTNILTKMATSIENM